MRLWPNTVGNLNGFPLGITAWPLGARSRAHNERSSGARRPLCHPLSSLTARDLDSPAQLRTIQGLFSSITARTRRDHAQLWTISERYWKTTGKQQGINCRYSAPQHHHAYPNAGSERERHRLHWNTALEYGNRNGEMPVCRRAAYRQTTRRGQAWMTTS